MKKIAAVFLMILLMCTACSQAPVHQPSIPLPEASQSQPAQTPQSTEIPTAIPEQSQEPFQGEDTSITEALAEETSQPEVQVPTQVEESSEVHEGEILLTVNTPDGDLVYKEVPWMVGMTVYSLTQGMLDDMGIAYKATGFGDMMYFSSIGDYAERDYGPMSGWLYYVDGESPSVGCGQYELKPGQTVLWQYFTDE